MAMESLKLSATDPEDLVVLSSILQDATVLIGDMGYDDGQFMMVAARFIAADDLKANDAHSSGGSFNEGSSSEGIKGVRKLMGINFAGVSAVKRQGFSPSSRDDVLNILAIRANQTNIEIVFSGKSMVRLECDAIRIYAADLGEGWSTSFAPSH